MLHNIMKFLLIHWLLTYYITPDLIKRNKKSWLIIIDGMVWSSVLYFVIGFHIIYVPILLCVRCLLELWINEWIPKGTTFKVFGNTLLLHETGYIAIAIALATIVS